MSAQSTESQTLDVLLAEWGDAVAAVCASPGAPTPEAIDRLVSCGDVLALALRDGHERFLSAARAVVDAHADDVLALRRQRDDLLRRMATQRRDEMGFESHHACDCPCGCTGRTRRPGRCMVCRVKETCRQLP